MLTGGLYVLSL